MYSFLSIHYIFEYSYFLILAALINVQNYGISYVSDVSVL
jgi:hypothetical protein